MTPGDRVEIVAYPTHETDGGICADCDLNGLTGTIQDIEGIYVEVDLDNLPPALLGHTISLFLAKEIRVIS